MALRGLRGCVNLNPSPNRVVTRGTVHCARIVLYENMLKSFKVVISGTAKNNEAQIRNRNIQCIKTYIPLISRVRGPYGKLWTEFFPSFYGQSAKRAGHANKQGKNEDP